METKKTDWWEITYLVIYGMILTYNFLTTTVFPIPYPQGLRHILFGMLVLYVLAKVIWLRCYSKKELIFSALILIAFIIPAVVAGYTFLLEIGFLIVGAKKVNLDKILTVYVVIGIAIMAAAFWASQTGRIVDLISWKGTQIRHSFGILYTTDFAAHVFYLILAGACIHNRTVSIPAMIIPLFFALFVWKECYASTSFICISLFVVMMFAIKCFGLRTKPVPFGRWKYAFTSVPIVCCVGFYALLEAYQRSGSAILDKLNDLLNNRLSLSVAGENFYGYTFFGQPVLEIGNGGVDNLVIYYFFLDNSYVSIAMKYGIILLFVVLLILVFIGVRNMKAGRWLVVAAVIMFSIHSVMEHHLLELAYNPFLFALLAELSYDKIKQENSIFLIDVCGYKV